MKNRCTGQGRPNRLIRKNENGQALIELAVTVPLFFLLLFGSAELARFAYVSIEVSNAAEAAVRYGAQNNTTAQDLTGMQAAAETDAGNIALDAPTISNTCGCVDGSASGSSCTSFTCASGSAAVETLYVTTSITFDPLVHIPGLPQTFTVYGYAHQKVLY